MIEHLYAQHFFHTVKDWHKSQESSKVLADIKAMLKYAPFIDQESIQVEKGFGGFFQGSRKKGSCHNALDPTKSSNLFECLVGYKEATSYVGYYYQVTFSIRNHARSVNVVTKEQYLEGLKFLNLESHVKLFETYRDCGYFYLNTQHCEEGPGANRYPPSPLDVPIGLDAWATTKLLQRLGYEGVNIQLNGVVTLSGSHNSTVLSNKKLARITNQSKGTRVVF
jgi:hypothetical protein